MAGYGTRIATLVLLMLLALSIFPASTSAQSSYSIRVDIISQDPTSIDEGDSYSITIRVTNTGLSMTGTKRLDLFLSSGGETITPQQSFSLGPSPANTSVNFTFTIDDPGAYSIILEASAGTEYVEIQGLSNRVLISDLTVNKVEVKFDWTPIIIAVPIVVVVVIVAYVMRARKLKQEEEQRIAEEARRQELIRKKEAEIAKKIEVRDVLGKHPRDYYIVRRQKFARMRPAGMTSSGLTILKHEKTKAEIEADIKIQCPKCGTELAEKGAECPRCNAVESIEAVRHQIRAYKSSADVDFKDAEALLRKAEHRINWSDFDAANDFVTQAQERMMEDWRTYKRGGTVSATVTEYTEGKGPTADAKIIGLEGEKVAIPVSQTVATPEIPESAGGTPCPNCGKPMYDEVCHYCDFDGAMNACWAIIEEGEIDGAPLDEVKELCRQAKSAMERGSDELAVRYLRRAKTLGMETKESHSRTKSEGIIKFTQTLFKQVEAMGEDITTAKVMLDKAEVALAEGDDKQARSYAAKADGYLKQLREDSNRKRANELLSKAGASSLSAEAATLVEKARKLIAAKEFEGAVDLLEAALAKK